VVERWLWEPEVAGSSPVAPRARSSAGQSKGFLIPRSGVRVPPGPLVFIHGFGFSSEVFKTFPGIKIDLPFHGNSKLKSRGLRALAQEIAIRIPNNSTVVGWSMGGTLALLLALLFPSKVKALLLIGATACFPCLWDRKNLKGFLLRLRKEREEFLKEFRERAYPKPFDVRVELEGALGLLEDYFSTDLRSYIPHINKPILLLHGTKDPIVPLRGALELYNLSRRAKLITFAGGHFPENEAVILKVLKGIKYL
jgi:pimeloyl-[acyl-carrier protein] methyl ester esterase